MKFRMKAAVAGLAAIAMTLTACGGGGGDSQGGAGESAGTDNKQLSSQAQFNEQPRENIQDGGSLTTALTEITAQFNTFQADGTRYTLDVWQWYNPQLALFSPDGEWSPNPAYLTDVTKDEVDGKTVVTYTINPEATFNDGEPIDWRAFEATWKTSNGTNTEYLASSTDGYSLIESVTQGEDERQAVVTFSTIYAWPDGLFNYVLHPKAAADPETYNTAYINEPNEEWGAGPYTVDSYDSEQGVITFKRNDKWWGEPGKLESRTFRAMESSASINAFKNGEIDATEAATRDRLAQVQAMPEVDVRRSATPSTSLMTVNAEDPLLGEADVRKAIMMGVDRATLLEIRYQGLDYTEEAPGSLTLFPFQQGYQDNLGAAGYAYDKDGAIALLEGAGWMPGEDGIREKDGERLSIVYPVIGDDPSTQAVSKAINSMLKEIGVEAVLEQHPSSDFSDVFLGGQFGIFLMGFASSDPFGFAYFCQIWCSDSSLNVSKTGTPEIDQKIKELTQIGDEAEQIEAGNALETEIMAETWGLLPLYNGPTIIATKPGLANYGADLFGIGPVENIGWQVA